jgi:hypothetical protein
VVSAVHLLTTHHVTSIEVTGECDIIFTDLELKSLPLGMHVSELLRAKVSHDALNLSSLDLWLIVV